MKKRTVNRLERFFWVLIYLLIVLLYLHNLTHDIFGGDVGDLVTSSLTHGVAHPPGYPLFVMLGYIFGHLPINLAPVTKVGLVSMVSSILALVLFQKIIGLFIKNIYIKVLSVFILAFSYLFWLYAEVPEVFSLNSFLSLGVIYFLVRFYKKPKFKYLLLAFFFYGLGLTNHMTIVLTAPLTITVTLVKRRDVFSYGKKLFLIPLAILAGLLPYIYLPLASLTNPLIEWNKIDSVGSFFHHVLRRDYGTFSAGAFYTPLAEAKLIILKTYILTIMRSITLPAFLISIIGIYFFIKKEKALGIGLLLTFLFSGPFFITYSGFPIADFFVLGISERFYILSQIILLIFFPFGIAAIYSMLKNSLSKKIYAQIILGVFALIPLLMLKVNFSKADLSKTNIGIEFAKSNFTNLPNGSVLFLTGDTRSFNSWYTYFILGYRKDINLVQVGDFGIKNKFFDSLRSEISNNTDLDGNDLFINALLKASETKNVYTTIDITVPNSYKWLPMGIVKKLIKKDDMPTEDEYSRLVDEHLKDIKIPYEQNLSKAEEGFVLRSILTNYSSAINNIGSTYLSEYNDNKAASLYYTKAILIDPEYSESYKNFAILYSLQNQCDKAQVNIKKAIDLYPVNVKYYDIWHQIAKDCFKTQAKEDEVKNSFYESFGLNLDEVNKKNNDKK